MVNELIRTGALAPEDAEKSQYRNVITRAVGLYPTVRTDTLHVELVDGDRLLLCTDGLTDMVPAPLMLKLLGNPNVLQAADTLIAAALERGGKDNVTVLVIDPEATLEAEAVAARARVMESLFLFEELPFQARLRVGRIVNELFVSPSQLVVKRGDIGDKLYVVIQGQMSVLVDGVEVACLTEGEHFGELALVDGEPRSADIVAKGFAHLLCIEREVFREFCLMEPTLGNVMLWKLVATLGKRLSVANMKMSGK
jgi:protein phosphatase